MNFNNINFRIITRGNLLLYFLVSETHYYLGYVVYYLELHQYFFKWS